MDDLPDQDIAVIQLNDVLDVKAAGPLHIEFLGKRGIPIVIDASQVQRVGAQCLQVLLSAKASWTADQQEFAILASSESFDQSLALFGATALMQDVAGASK